MLLPKRWLAARLLAWYDRHRRELPWRLPIGANATLDAYHVLVSEAMLQQTQVATVIPYYVRFIERFPTVQSLAAAEEQEVLRLWQGLGYYTRARNLRHAAQSVVNDHGGAIPDSVEALLRLPGVGRYTAGAVASIAFGRRAPILDGNVARVICRMDRIESDPREKSTLQLLWRRAEELLPDPPKQGSSGKTSKGRPSRSPRYGDFNSALMELGATVCTPRNPQCLICPVRRGCRAAADGVQDRIPPPRERRIMPLLRRWTICIGRVNNGRTEWLLEQRPDKGRWAGMWQFVTIDPSAVPFGPKRLRRPTARTVQSVLSIDATEPRRLGIVTHTLTHRRYRFDVFHCRTEDGERLPQERSRAWATLEGLSAYPLPKPQLKAVELLVARAG